MHKLLPFPRLARGPTLALLLALPAGCALDGPVRETGYAPCHVLGSSDWKAHVEFSSTSSPIPYLTRKLVVTGKVRTVAGYHASLAEGPIARLDEPIQQVRVRTEGSAEPGGAPVVHDVRGVFPAIERYGGVAIRCGDGIIAEIRDVPVPPREKHENPFSW
ncbi:MAG TPA: hypothetical protein VFQ67_15700 [Allosphingosinicella sp.]|jgi:hypothetical protein|nr:hypothetical protein [Allosphingosinicella sp.]